MSATASVTATKAEMDSLLAQLEREADSAGSSMRRSWARILSAVFLHVVVLLIVCQVILSVWLGWETSSWPITPLVLGAVIATSILLIVSVGSLIIAIAAPRLVTSPARDHVLQVAATVGDDRLAPLIEPQPTPIPTAELADEPTQLGPIPFATSAGQEEAQGVGTGIVLIIFLIGMLLMNDAQQLPWLDRGWLGGIFRTLEITGAFGLFYALAFQTFLRAAPLTRVTVVAHGVRWRASWLAGWRTISWAEARAFTCITYTYEFRSSISLQRTRTATVYLLEAPGTALLWTVPTQATAPTYRPAPARESAAARAAAQTLVRLVATRTALPLRDLSALAVELNQRKTDPARVVLARYANGGGAANIPAAVQAAIQPKRRPFLAISYVVLIALMLSAALGAGFSLHQRQPGYYASLPQRLNAVAASAQLAPQSLTVGPAGAATNLAPGQYGDVAVTVTLNQRTNTNGWAGLTLHSAGANGDNVVFRVSPSGAWQLADGYNTSDPYAVAQGTSAAIHPGLGAQNRLLVIARAGLYLLYVNDTLVRAYFDSYSDLATSGAVGVYASGATTSVQFSVFAIYPTKPITSFQYV